MSVGRFKTLSRFALVGLIGGGSAACSSDTMRFGDPFSNPFASNAKSPDATTGSLPNASASPKLGRAGSVQAQPLGAPQPAFRSAALAQPTEVSKSVSPPTGATAGWTAQGGTSVTVGAGDTLALISNRYGVPPAAILSSNGLSNASQVSSGRQIVIPVYNAAGAQGSAPRVAAAPAVVSPAADRTKLRFVEGPKAAPAKAEDAKKHVRPGQAVAKREPGKPVAEVAETGKKHVRPGQATAKRDESNAVAQRHAEPAKVAKLEPVKAAKGEVSKPVKVETPKVAKAEPAKTEPVQKVAALVAPAAKAPEPAKAAPVKEPEQTASVAQAPADAFRWPARGRVISGYGTSGNEGINIAVPEGTPVKAAEEGTVAYAGSDVKGYGNLVLVRHTNGYVSAYAHNGEVSVRPGEKVKRGQVIAKSGQTGNVTSPQLHFELRKGASPVDPMPHLASN